MQYSAALKTTRMNAVKDAIDAGGAAGVLEIGTAGMASLLAEIPLSFPCGAVAGAVLTLTMPHSDTNANNSGVAAAAQIKTSTGTIVVSSLTVGGTAEGTGGGKDIVLAASTIAAGMTVTINSATLTHG